MIFVWIALAELPFIALVMMLTSKRRGGGRARIAMMAAATFIPGLTFMPWWMAFLASFFMGMTGYVGFQFNQAMYEVGNPRRLRW